MFLDAIPTCCHPVLPDALFVFCGVILTLKNGMLGFCGA